MSNLANEFYDMNDRMREATKIDVLVDISKSLATIAASLKKPIKVKQSSCGTAKVDDNISDSISYDECNWIIQGMICLRDNYSKASMKKDVQRCQDIIDKLFQIRGNINSRKV